MAIALRRCGFRFTAGMTAVVLMLAAGGAGAGTDSASFRVGLRITASCEVDSAAALDPARRAVAPPLPVSCSSPTPRVVRISREPGPPPVAAPDVAPGEVRVVTLIF